jgi:DNA mismatch endonuclease (patch repair protein)
VDTLNPAKRSRNMAQVKGKHTKPEKLVRSLLHTMGYRFRLCVKKLAGTPDIVLPRHKAVIFVHGCFWHGHEDCKRATIPATNTEFWRAKITGNKERDRRRIAALEALGYRCLTIWQCEMRDSVALKKRLAAFLR